MGLIELFFPVRERNSPFQYQFMLPTVAEIIFIFRIPIIRSSNY